MNNLKNKKDSWARSFQKFVPMVYLNDIKIGTFSFPTDDMLRPEDFSPAWFKNPTSLEIDFGVTQGCTDACWFCNYGRHLVKNPISLNMDFIDKTIEEFVGAGGVSIAFSHLGEAFYHKDFKRILEKIDSYPLLCKNISNGTKLLNPNNDIFETYSMVDHQRFSIDSVDDESRSLGHYTGATTQKTIPGVYRKYIDNLHKYIVYLKDRRIRQNKIIGATMLIAPYVLRDDHSLFDTIKELSEIGLDYVKIRPILDEGNLACNLLNFTENNRQRLEYQLPEIQKLNSPDFWIKFSDFKNAKNIAHELTTFDKKINETKKKEKCWISTVRPHIDPFSSETAKVYPCLRSTWEGDNHDYQVIVMDKYSIRNAFKLGNHPIVPGCQNCCNESMNQAAIQMENIYMQYGDGIRFVSEQK
ncbi:MAG: Radical SAM protein [uncultured bacterium]|nr:MAG: Radical SAM protein [uncultured bacterium]